MKRKFRLLSSGVASVVGLACSAGFAAFVTDNFDSQGSGTAPAPAKGWAADSGAVVTNAVYHSSANSLFLPVLSGITNTAASGNSGLVWTDFYTKPVLLSAAAPAVDTNATAQVFVNSNGMWATLSGVGDGATVITNTWLTTIASGSVYPTVTVASAWHHVSVLHDYTAATWDLYVDDIPLATNLGFIASGATASAWFQVQNLGGDSSNVVWVDDFMISNKMSVALATNTAAGETNGIPVSVTVAYFDTTGDPRPVTTNVGAVGDSGVQMQFAGLTPGVNYVVLRGASPSGSGMTSNGVINSGTASYTDATALAAANRYFYRLTSVSPVDSSVVLTNAETYAAYKQTREASRSYIVGVPVAYSGSDMTLAGKVGTQLASGLADTDKLTVSQGGALYSYTLSGGVWSPDAGSPDPDTVVLASGSGVLIQRSSVVASTTNAVFAGLQQTNATSVALAAGSWNIVAWPYDNAGTLGAALSGSPAASDVASDLVSGDYAWIQRAGTINPVPARRTSSAWIQSFIRTTGTSLNTYQLQPGDGVIYHKAASGSTATWAPVRP